MDPGWQSFDKKIILAVVIIWESSHCVSCLNLVAGAVATEWGND